MQVESHIVRAILKQNEFLLRRHLVLSPTVLDKMKTDGVITDVSKKKISTAPALRQVQLLLKLLESSGLHILHKFLGVLRATGHSWLVDKILDSEITQANPDRVRADTGAYREHGRFGHSDDSVGYTRPFPTHFPDHSATPKQRTVMFDPESIRKSTTAPSVSQYNDAGEMTLGELLRAREPKEEASMSYQPRGVYHARTLLTDPTILRQQTSFPSLGQHGHHIGPQIMMSTNSKDEIPMTLYTLNEAIADQDNQNQQALGVLKQEAFAIRQLMDQNARDQGNLRRKQAAVDDIVTRLRDIHHRARDVYQPAPHPNISRYRLSQLNSIPWSVDN